MITHDFKQAIEFGDLDAATASADACTEILRQLGEHRAAIGINIDLAHALSQVAGSAEEFGAIRRRAMTTGARAQALRWPAAQMECWLIAVDNALLAGEIAKRDRQRDLLLAAFRDLVDAAEFMADLVPESVAPEQRKRLSILMTTIIREMHAREWPERLLLTVRALVMRASSASERVVHARPGSELFSGREGSEPPQELLRLLSRMSER